MLEFKNSNTQPLRSMEVFNNWNSIVESWYSVGSVSSLRKSNIISTTIGNQELVIFRTSEGQVHCLDAFCSHMGLRLSTGTIKDNHIRCKFHHWSYDGNGTAKDANCQKLSGRNLNSYPVAVRYGIIWVWAGREAKYPLPYHPNLPEGSFRYKLGKTYERPSHPHISLLNALDVQHVNTVHALELAVEGSHKEIPEENSIHFDFTGKFLRTSAAGKRNAFLTGGSYHFSVRYSGSTVGYLKALEGIRLLSFIPFPAIYATFGYRQEGRKTIIQPVFLTPKRKGLLGFLLGNLHLWITKIIYYKLKEEDGEIYENIRFTPHLNSKDSNVGAFIVHVNKLPKSIF